MNNQNKKNTEAKKETKKNNKQREGQHYIYDWNTQNEIMCKIDDIINERYPRSGYNKRNYIEKYLEISYSSYNNYINGIKMPVCFLIQIVKKLDISIDHLCGLSKKNDNPLSKALYEILITEGFGNEKASKISEALLFLMNVHR